MSKHTPGPWKLAQDGGAGNRTRLVILGPRTLARGELAQIGDKWRAPDDEDRANARLIAAAPALLEALRGVANYIRILEREGYITDDDVKAVRAAIAQAEGGKP